MTTITLARKFRFEAAHRLNKHKGQCKHLHGHTYKGHVEIEGPVGEDGMVLDFQNMKALLNMSIGLLDHSLMLHENDELVNVMADHGQHVVTMPYDPTVENLSKRIGLSIQKYLDEDETLDAWVKRVVLYETPECWAIWRPLE